MDGLQATWSGPLGMYIVEKKDESWNSYLVSSIGPMGTLGEIKACLCGQL